MQTIKTDILIIGAGLTGLTLAYFLKNLNVSVKIVEANSKAGGRIKTKYNTNNAPIELGATWLINEQKTILDFLTTLEIPIFEQYYGNSAIYHPKPNKTPQLVPLPENNSKSYRIKNGSFSIIECLLKKLNFDTINFNSTITSIVLNNNTLEAYTKNRKYICKHIISTLPPLLFHQNITTKPELPKIIQEVLLNTHTWMHNSIRVGFTYNTPFWKTKGTSGTIYSGNGIIQEFYDHSNAQKSKFALSGFLNTSFYKNTKTERKNLALKQLQNYFGNQALDFETYEECVWQNQKNTTANDINFLPPQTNNGHPIYKNAFLDGKLFIAGTETSPVFSGKMEGAITSSQFIFRKLKTIYK